MTFPSNQELRLDQETHCYYVGERIVPGVNEILGVWKRIKVKGMFYHVNTFNGVLIPSSIMKKCATIGGKIHDLCAKITLGRRIGRVPTNIKEVIKQYRLFLKLFNIKPFVIEGSFYSTEYDYAGTLDLFATASGKECEKIFGEPSILCVWDIKTGKLCWTAGPQMSAYKMLLWESEHWPKEMPYTKVRRAVISLPRNGSAFSIVPMSNPKDRDFFLARRWEKKYRDELIKKCKQKAR